MSATLLILIPAFNEGASLPTLVERVRAMTPRILSVGIVDRVDLVVINDGSTDDTSSVARSLSVPVVELSSNLGIGGAVQCGYLYARRRGYDYAVQIDGDGQHDPAFVPHLLESIIAHRADLVIGSRYLSSSGYTSTLPRRLGKAVISLLIRIFHRARITDPTSGMRLAGKRAIALFSRNYAPDYPEPESAVACLDAGLKVREVSVDMAARTEGQSSINARRSVYYMVRMFFSLAIVRLFPERSS